MVFETQGDLTPRDNDSRKQHHSAPSLPGPVVGRRPPRSLFRKLPAFLSEASRGSSRLECSCLFPLLPLPLRILLPLLGSSFNAPVSGGPPVCLQKMVGTVGSAVMCL